MIIKLERVAILDQEFIETIAGMGDDLKLEIKAVVPRQVEGQFLGDEWGGYRQDLPDAIHTAFKEERGD